ncbi:MAG: fibronectin type III domain-containing protein, partial [Syntrophales bacterium]
MSDMNQNSFFDIAASYNVKVYFGGTAASPTDAMLDNYASNIRIVVGGMSGPVVHYVGDGTTTYSDTTDIFTITGVSSMGWTWAYDITGAHLNSQGQQVDTSTTKNLILTTTSRKISGTITLGASCVAGGQNKEVVIFAMPDQVDTGGTGFKPMDPAFFKTGPTNGQTACQTTYSIGIPSNGVYRVEAHIPPDVNASSVSSSTFTDPESLPVTISDSAPTATGKNFTFTSATHRIVGTVQKPSGSFGGDERGMLWVFAYQPRENGKGTGTQVANDSTFTLYVTKGTWKVGVGGENMSFPVEVQVDVDDTYLIASSAKGPTIIIAPPSDFIEGYVKDSAGNGLANSSLYAWLEGGPGGGNAQTDSQGYYKMYVTPGSNYHIGANSQSYGFLGEQSNIAVTSSTHPTVNFTVSSSNNYTISGIITKSSAPLQQAFIFITEAERGQMLGSGGTDAAGAYTIKISGGDNRWIHVGLPGKGEIYTENLGTISANNASKNIAVTSSTIKVRISPDSSFTQAFVGVHSDTDGGFSDIDVATGSPGYREYQIDVRRPTSGSTTYYIDGGIPGYGPLPQTSVVLSSGGAFTESSGTTNDGIIEITLGGLYTISGTVSGDNVKDAWVFASGPSGGGGGAVATNGTYSIQLRDGTYDIGVGKPSYIGNKITTIVNGADVPLQNLALTTATNTITGTVYLPNGTTTATNAKVWAENGSGGWAGGSTDASGNYTLSVDSGSWTVKAAYDGYNSTRILVTAPASGKNITLVTVSGFAPNTKNSPITPSSGGIVSGTGIKVDFPKNALGTGTSAGTVEVKSTTNVVLKNDRQLIGTAKEITARNSSNQNVTTLSGSITIELTVTKAELVTAGLTFAQAQAIKITYYDSTGGSWVEIPTVVTLSVPSATTIAGLDDDPAITLTGTTTHLSTYAPSIPTDSDAPPAPTGLSATASDVSAVLSWTASAGATKYDVYKKVGADYPYLAQTTSTSYTATGLTNGTVYYFKVSALDSSSPNKESAATSEVSVTPVASSSGRHGSSTASVTSAVSTVTPAVPAVPATPVTGCSVGNLFNTQTGAACVNNAVEPQGCSGGNLFNTQTGAACPVSATPATPATPAVPTVAPATPATPATPGSYSFGTTTLKNG